MLALGVDPRRAPTAVREALAFDGERRHCGLDAWKDHIPDGEFVLLSTCNRVELYAADETGPPDGAAPAGFLARFHDLSVERLHRHLVARRDEAAVGYQDRGAYAPRSPSESISVRRSSRSSTAGPVGRLSTTLSD